MNTREIKFRALWDGKWYYQTLEEMLTINLAAFRLGKHKTQFTGIYDKNGKEVYEGDYDENYDVVAWCDNKSGWAMKAYDFPSGEFIDCHCYNCQGDFEITEEKIIIAGTIYDYPELLNQ